MRALGIGCSQASQDCCARATPLRELSIHRTASCLGDIWEEPCNLFVHTISYRRPPTARNTSRSRKLARKEHQMKINATRCITALALFALWQAQACTIKEATHDDHRNDAGSASDGGGGKSSKPKDGSSGGKKSGGDHDVEEKDNTTPGSGGQSGNTTNDTDNNLGGASGDDNEDDQGEDDSSSDKKEDGADKDAKNKVISVDVAFAHGCRAYGDGRVECRGDGRHGELGANAYGTVSHDWVPVKSLAGRAVEVAVGSAHSCALLEDGTIQCWGQNNYGELGDGTKEETELPVTVVGLSGVSMISAGGYKTCAVLKSSGEVRCWGSNHRGQLGNGSKTSPQISTTPLEVVGLDDIERIDVGVVATCAVRKGGKAFCWGDNRQGTLGNGETTDSAVPTPVTNIETAVDISVGELHSCAVVADGGTWCWGTHKVGSWYGVLGTGISNVSHSAVPVPLEDAPAAKRVSVGDEYTCIISSSNGSVWCWGTNNGGRLGNGKSANSATPVVAVSAPNDTTVIAAGNYTVCAVRRGTDVCWGG